MLRRYCTFVLTVMVLLAFGTPGSAAADKGLEILWLEADMMYASYVNYYLDKKIIESDGDSKYKETPEHSSENIAQPANDLKMQLDAWDMDGIEKAYEELMSHYHPHRKGQATVKKIAEYIYEANALSVQHNDSSIKTYASWIKAEVTNPYCDLAATLALIEDKIEGYSGGGETGNPALDTIKAELNELIAACETKLGKHADKSELAGYTAYTAAIGIAKAEADNPSATVDDIGAAKDALARADEVFDEFLAEYEVAEQAKLDKQKVQDKIKEAREAYIAALADAVNVDDMVASCKPANDLMDAINIYELQTSFTAEQAKSAVDDLTARMAALQEYIDTLKNKVDTSRLQSTKTIAEELLKQLESEGHGNIGKNMRALIEQAASLLAEQNPSKDVVDRLVKQLEEENEYISSFLENFAEATDDSLKQLLDKSKDAIKNAADAGYITGENGGYNQQVADRLNELIQQAEEKLNKGNITQEERATLMADLKKAQQALADYIKEIEDVAARREELDVLIAEAERLLSEALEQGSIILENGEYNNQYANTLANLIAQARNMKDGDISLDALTDILTDMRIVNNNLKLSISQNGNQEAEEIPGLDKGRLATAIANAQAAIAAADNGYVAYEDGAVAEMKAQLTAAQAVHKNAMSQAEIDNAANKLLSALDAFVAKQLDTADSASGWRWESDGLYYYENGIKRLAMGWFKDAHTGKWYYLKQGGAATIGWLKDGGRWYYLQQNGQMKTGWLADGVSASGATQWYYLSGSGAMSTGWIKDGAAWYYLKGSGAMATGWVKDGGCWYLLKNSGAMATGWARAGNHWYYLAGSGEMKTGWIKDNSDKWYYLNSGGEMAAGTTVGLYRLGADGAWIE